ncbi:MAG: hypothetical protein K2X81_07490, partial [Candidatus Obscuribacterales bacterium]|nr:hypothetical protein [Candidatus Obscuribacterales bacterium]
QGAAPGGLYNNMDMQSFSAANQNASNNASRFLPSFDEAALTDRCAELGSDAGSCVKAIKRQGLA